MNDEQKAKHDFWLHQDNLLWSRVQFLVAVQSGVIAGTYVIGSDRQAANCLLILGIILTAMIFFVVERDQVTRDEAFKATGIVQTNVSRRICAPLKGREIIRIVFAILLTVDLILLRWVAIGAPHDSKHPIAPDAVHNTANG